MSNNNKTENFGYHLKHIQKGILGEFSKVEEEFEEFEDALEQNNPIMVIVELVDMYGAIQKYREKYQLESNYEGFGESDFDLSETQIILKNIMVMCRYFVDVNEPERIDANLTHLEINIIAYLQYYNLTKENILTMLDATERAFKSGRRS